MNEISQKNLQLKSQIDEKRKECNKYELIIKDIKQELSTKKKQVGSVNRVEKTAAEQRDKAQKQLNRMIAGAERDKQEMD